jgi:hypothetical protein
MEAINRCIKLLGYVYIHSGTTSDLTGRNPSEFGWGMKALKPVVELSTSKWRRRTR